MRPGYKHTEVGLIPEVWQDVLLDRVAKRGSGHTPDKKHPEYWNGNIKWISLADSGTLDQVFIDDTISKITPEGLAHSSAVLHPAGTVVLSRDAGVGKSAIMRTEMAVSQHFMAWRCGPELDNHFLYYWLQAAKPQFERIANGTTIKTIGLPYFKNLRIPCPPHDEQCAIAEALSDVDALLVRLSQLIAKKRDLKQAAIQQLLTGQTRLPGFRGEWEVMRLGELGTFLKGSAVKKDEARSGELPCVRYGEIYTHHDDYIRSFNSWISREVADTATPLRRGDILFAGSGETKEEIGKCVAFVDKVEAYAGGDIVILRPTGANSMFLGYLLNTPAIASQKASRGQGDAVVHISGGALANIHLSVPGVAEQTAIAAVLSDMDAELSALEARRDKTRALKQAMMQELLTGKTRLVAPSSNVVSVDFTTKPKSARLQRLATKPHNWQINEAVVVAVLVKQFGSEQYPLGRKRCTKLAYLLHRHVEHVTQGYLKKAAGPYNPAVKYKGPEGIAQKNGYIRAHKNGNYSGFVAADNIGQAEDYFGKWYGQELLGWLEQFRKKPNDELELLTTVDLAVVEIEGAGKQVRLDAVKFVIGAHPEWEAKLERTTFSDTNIARAIRRVSELFAPE